MFSIVGADSIRPAGKVNKSHIKLGEFAQLFYNIYYSTAQAANSRPYCFTGLFSQPLFQIRRVFLLLPEGECANSTRNIQGFRSNCKLRELK